MPRFIAEIDVTDEEITRVGGSLFDVMQGIYARLHPVVACHPDEVLSERVVVRTAP